MPPRDIAISLSFLLLPLAASRSYSQSLLPESPHSASLAQSVVASSEANSFASNPSQLRADSLHPFRAGLIYAPFVGGLKDASQSSAEGIYYSSYISSSIGIGVTELSYADLYSDLSIYGSLVRSFTLANNRKASVGVRLRYETLSTTPDYPKLHFLFADIGFTLDLTPDFSLGGTALNLLGAKYEVTGGEAENLDRRFLLGIAYHPPTIPIKIFTVLEEDAALPLTISFGAEYDPVTFLAVRLGTSTDTGNITTGIGIIYSNFSFDVGSRFDKALGSVFTFGAGGQW